MRQGRHSKLGIAFKAAPEDFETGRIGYECADVIGSLPE